MKIPRFIACSLTLSHILLIIFCTSFQPINAQIIWFEDFSSYADGTDTGDDNNTANGDDDWTSDCNSCEAGDWFEVRGGAMEGHDTNGPTELLTEEIDISAFSDGVDFSVDIDAAGSLEECDAGCGCTCVDFVEVLYSIDGGAWIPVSSNKGGVCTNGCAGGDYAILGDNSATVSKCVTGSTLEIRISVQTWAAGEYYFINSIMVEASGNCPVLPIVLSGFQSQYVHDQVHLKWQSEVEINVSHFQIQKSTDGFSYFDIGTVTALGNTSTGHDYFYSDQTLGDFDRVFYRIRTYDFNGASSVSDVQEVLLVDGEQLIPSIYPNPSSGEVYIHAESRGLRSLKVYDLQGRRVSEFEFDDLDQTELKLDLAHLPKGFYLYELLFINRTSSGKLSLIH